ncbi:MAG TPA: DoxX family protein [Bryobacteraceae bacterium]
MIKLPKAAVPAIAILLAVVFVYAGIAKLGGPQASRWGERLAHWGYPPNARYVIGAFELLGGIGVLIPRCRRAAAAILVAIMIGALCTHAIHGELPRLIPPLVLGGLAFLLYLSRSRPREEQTPDRAIGVSRGLRRRT